MPDSLSAWYVTQIRAIERASTALRAIGRRSIRESMAGLKRGLSATHAAAGGRQRARAAQPGWRTTKSLRPKKNPVTLGFSGGTRGVEHEGQAGGGDCQARILFGKARLQGIEVEQGHAREAGHRAQRLGLFGLIPSGGFPNQQIGRASWRGRERGSVEEG